MTALAVLHTLCLIWTLFCVTTLRGPPIEFRVRENLSGALVGQLLNHSKEQNSSDISRWKSLHFIIANQQDVTDRFSVSQDGTIYTQRGLDREERDIYRLTLITENSRGLIRGAGVYQVCGVWSHLIVWKLNYCIIVKAVKFCGYSCQKRNTHLYKSVWCVFFLTDLISTMFMSRL